MLYIVATPIGNLKEITYRAVETLQNVEYILCEDTRTSKVLMDSYNISKPLKSYHKYNEIISSKSIIEDLQNGKDIALISDAGMPGISDPGNILVNACIENNVEYTVVSGPSALINAFVLSGFDTPFTFVGFLSDNSKKRKETKSQIADIKTTLIFYCSPHSLVQDLQELYEVLGDRRICVVREISKKFEEFEFSTLAKGFNGTIKGEFVVIIDALTTKNIDTKNLDEDLQTLINMGLSKSEASKVLAKAKGLKKNDIYKMSLDK